MKSKLKKKRASLQKKKKITKAVGAFQLGVQELAKDRRSIKKMARFIKKRKVRKLIKKKKH